MQSPSALPDKNPDFTYYDITRSPISVTGFPWREENGTWNRVPEKIMAQLPEGLAWVAPQPSGGMIRFRSNAKSLQLRVHLTRAEKSANVTPAALSGFCLYRGEGRDKKFTALLAPNEPMLAYEAKAHLPGDGTSEWTLYTPLQNLLGSVEIGLPKDATLEAPLPFDVPRPIAFYGSSITCGFCASRPGLTYPAQICRAVNAELINFGFGGNAKGETIIAETLASLDLSCLVIDYDHNSPDVDHLRATHAPFFKLIRQRRPELPIILVSSPNYHKAPEYFEKRRQVIADTYEDARQSGDRHVWFVDGRTYFTLDEWADMTIDCLHPNDSGFGRMAQTILPVVQEALKST
jgi:lysophospholipase L1-like esterase